MSRDMAINRKVAAQILGFSLRTLHRKISKGQLRQEPDGSFTKHELAAFKQRADLSGEKEGQKIANLTALAHLRLKEQRAVREELLVKQIEGLYISKDDVLRAWASRIKELSTCLWSWQNSIPPLIEGKTKHEISKILEREVCLLLEKYSRTGRWTPSVITESDPEQNDLPKKD